MYIEYNDLMRLLFAVDECVLRHIPYALEIEAAAKLGTREALVQALTNLEAQIKAAQETARAEAPETKKRIRKRRGQGTNGRAEQ